MSYKTSKISLKNRIVTFSYILSFTVSGPVEMIRAIKKDARQRDDEITKTHTHRTEHAPRHTVAWNFTQTSHEICLNTQCYTRTFISLPLFLILVCLRNTIHS